MNKHSHVRSFLSVVTRPRAEPAVNDFPVVAWKAAEGKLRLLSLMCIYCGCLKLVASQCAICRAILPGVQPGNGLEPVRDILSVLYCIITYYNIYCIILYIYIYIYIYSYNPGWLYTLEHSASKHLFITNWSTSNSYRNVDDFRTLAHSGVHGFYGNPAKIHHEGC